MALKITYEIHPAIGIARLGQSDKVFLAPEPDCIPVQFDGPGAVPRPPRTPPPPKYRDETGAVMRQAARFRVFKVVRDHQANDVKIVSCEELRKPEVTIDWKVHLVNRKAAGKQFEQPGVNRNDDIKGTERDKLIIDAGNKAPVGNDVNPAGKLEGKFMNKPVTLGHAWTDKNNGWLMVAGGKGMSEAVPGFEELGSFADNDGWYDDTSDGPVTATLTLSDGTKPTVEGAWLIVAPFDFAPEIESFITLYDVARNAAVRSGPGWLKMPLAGTTGDPAETNFMRDVLPVLARTRRYRWVNSWALQGEGQKRHTMWRDRDALIALATPDDATGGKWRKALFAHLLDPDDPGDSAGIKRDLLMPRIWDHDGDETKVEVLPLTPLQYRHFKNWSEDQFNGFPPVETEFLCDALDRIALEACSGGPFYPGIEAPRIMRDAGTYEAPFRFRQDLAPGIITEGLAVPWQADFHDCRMDSDLMWWPASRPDQVFTGPPTVPFDEQGEADVRPWADGVQSREAMVEHWHRLGIVKKFPAGSPSTGTNATIPLKSKMPEVDDPFASNPSMFFFYEDERGKIKIGEENKDF